MKKRILKVVTAGLVLASSVGFSACEFGKDEELNYSFYNYDNTYVVNETFSLQGAKLKITNKDGTETDVVVTDEMIKALPDMSTIGTKTITIVYNGNEFTLKVEVIEASVISSEISGYKSSYFTNEQFVTNDLELKLVYDNTMEETINVTQSMIESMPDMTTAGTKEIVINYNDESYIFSISVVEPTVLNYVVSGYKQSYFTNEEFLIGELKLKLNYNNNSEATLYVTQSMIESMPDMTTAGNKTVVVNYAGKQYPFTISVVAPSQINYEITGYQDFYFTTSTFTTDGLKLKVYYNNDTEEEVEITESMLQEMPNMTVAGNKMLLVNYNQKQYSFIINVVKPAVTSFEISGYKQTYFTSETFILNDIKLTLNYNDGNERVVDLTSEMVESMPNMTVAGNKVIVVNYEGKQYQFVINVIAPSQVKYEITGYKQFYFTNETLVSNELKLKLFYNNDTEEEVEITESMLQELPDMTTAGIKTVLVNYNHKQYSFSISVVEPSITNSIVLGYKGSYFTTDEFILDGLKLKLNYSNNTEKVVDITSEMIESMPDMTTAGNKTVVVNYEGEQYPFTISVVAPSQINYEITGYQDFYFTTSTFTTDGLKLKVYYNNDTEEEVEITESMLQEMPNMTVAGNKMLLVNYNQKQYSFTISIIEPSIENATITGYQNSYFTSQPFTTNGLKLNLEYNDGSAETVDIVDSMIKQVPNMTIPGSKTVVVMYGEDEYQFTIKVVVPKETSRQVIGYESVYDINSEFDLSQVQLKINLEDGNYKFVEVVEEIIEEMPDMSTEGIKRVVVIYNGVSTEISFEVKDFAKVEMLNKIQDFMKNYNSSDVKTSGIKINIEGTAKYLQDSAEFNEEITNITMSSLNNLEGYKIYKLEDYPYMFVKNYANHEEINNDDVCIDLISTNVNYVVIKAIDGNIVTYYGDINGFDVEYYWQELENAKEISFEEFKESIQFTYIEDGFKEITVFDSKLAQPIYKAITNAIVNSTMDIKKDDIISAKDNLSAQLDILKTLKNIGTNVTNIDFYNHFVNNILLIENDSSYVEYARTFIADLFEITDQNTIDELDYVLSKDIRKIRNNQLQDIETTYDMIVELNNIIKASNGNPTTINQLDIIVSGIDRQDKHMLSKFVYSLKDFAVIEERIYGEHEDYGYICNSLGGIIYDSYQRPENPYTSIYKYYTYQEVAGGDELIDEYYTGLKSLVERFENIADYTNVKTFAYDIISDMRAMDKVVQELEENGYEGQMINFYFTSSVRMAVEYYIEMYDAEMIADVLDMLELGMKKGTTKYEVLSDSMYPVLEKGDVVTIKPQSEFFVGDIVKFNTEYAMIHRIIAIIEENGETYYICHGDNVQSVNPENGSDVVNWEYDAQYIQSLINTGKTLDEIKSSIQSAQIVRENQIEGTVVSVNVFDVKLPENLVEALRDCADTIYLAFGKSEIDYIKLIEDICDRLELEKDYYVDKFNAGEITIFADIFDKYMGDLSEYEGAQLEFFTTLKATCNYLDSLLVYGTDRTELMNEINKAVKALYDVYAEMGEDYEYEQMLTDIVVRLTNTEKDFNANFKDIITEYKSIIKEFMTTMVIDSFNLSENESARKEFDHIANYYLTAYLKDEFVVGDLIADMNKFIDRYCEEDVRTYSKAIAILGTLVVNQEQDVDYNELFGSIELPNEIKDVDFNKLIKETLKDTNTYDILDLQDVKVDFITDDEGNVTKEVLTISLNAKYDILLSSMDAKVTLTLEINF